MTMLKKRMLLAVAGLAVAACVGGILILGAQVVRPQPGMVERAMPDFSLPGLDGNTVTLSQLKGKNVLLVFPRGRYDDNEWCQLCHYQYAELAELEQAEHFGAKHNAVVLFVLPYAKDVVQQWVTMFPKQMADIDTWRERSPGVPLPKKVTFRPGPGNLPIPILYDADQAVSKRLGLFSRTWDGTTTDQNVPTVFIIDKTGVVRFKYTSQVTFDRPSARYLVRMLAQVNAGN
jgi:peroxiredoxin